MTDEQRQTLAAGLRYWADELESGCAAAELRARLDTVEARLDSLAAALERARPVTLEHRRPVGRAPVQWMLCRF